jgi:hypothetical protein
MSIGGYFVSEEAENAATQKIIETFKFSKEAKARLEGTMNALGDKLAEFAKVLKNPSAYAFRIDQNGMTVGQLGGELRRPVMQLDQSDLDWQRLNEMLTNYDKARADKKQSAVRLRDMGLDISE